MNIEEKYYANFQELAQAGFQIRSEDPIKADMPKAEAAEAMVQGIMNEVFDVFRNTRLEDNCKRLAWGIVHAFFKQCEALRKMQDSVTDNLKDLLEVNDMSEIGSVELEKTQEQALSIEETLAAFETMTDHAALVYARETGMVWQPFSKSHVGKLSNTIIEARDYLAALAEKRRSRYTPAGPVVVFSGSAKWSEYEQIYTCLDAIKKRIPTMVLMTTGQRSGCDAIASAWAASQKITVISYSLQKGQGARGAFMRNDKMLSLKPVHVVVCKGSGVQINLADKARRAGYPISIIRPIDTGGTTAPEQAERKPNKPIRDSGSAIDEATRKLFSRET